MIDYDVLVHASSGASKTMSNHVDVTEETFKTEVLESPVLTVTDLWAEWCGPCKRLSPILDEIATEYEGKIKIAKLDVDANPNIPSQFGVMGIPTLLVFKDGQLLETIVGFQPKERLLPKLLRHLN
jgi:thioredoxin 1